MTRANINYVYQKVGENPKTLYYYQNGDQYPRGMRDFYHVLDFTNSDWSIESFKKWLGDNYRKTKSMIHTNPNTGVSVQANYVPTEKRAKPKSIKSPCIYYDDGGYPTDYSYVFDNCVGKKEVKVYEWDKLIFEGNSEKFEKWIKKQE